MKLLLFATAALLMGSQVYATSWRVCSRPSAGAQFSSVSAAMSSTSPLVNAGDTLYIEPGHIERADVSIDKRVVIIGPGYLLAENDIDSTSSSATPVFQTIVISSSAPKTVILGCRMSQIWFYADSVCIERCQCTGNMAANYYFSTNEDGIFIRNCLVYGNIQSTYPVRGLIEGNIILGRINNLTEATIRNNAVVATSAYSGGNYIMTLLQGCLIYNNVIINTNSSTATENSQLVYLKDYTIDYHSTDANLIYNNVLSTSASTTAGTLGALGGNTYGATTATVFTLTGNTDESKYMLKTNSVAIGTGVSGADCGAFAGIYPYRVTGRPYGKPYIYDDNTSNTPTNNTITINFKSKAQNE